MRDGLGRDGDRSCWAARPARAGGRSAPARAGRRRPPTVATIAARVEALRGLRFRSRPVPQRVSPAQARREGLEDLDRSYPEARRRADEEVLKLLGLIEPGRRPALDLGLGLRRGRRRLLRPALEAAADRLRDDTRRAQRNGSCTRADPRARGSAVRAGRRARGRATTPRWPGSRSSRAPRRSSCRSTCCATSAPRRRSAGCSASAFQTGPDLPQFLQDQLIWPVPRRRAVRPGAAPDRRRHVDAGRPRRPRARARQHRAGHAPGEVGGGGEAAAGAPATSRCTTAGGATASGTWGEWQTRELLGGRRRGRGRVGRGPLRALAARRRAPRRRAATPTCW